MKKVAKIVREAAANLADAYQDKEVVNLERFLRNKLQQAGFSSLQSTELAEDWVKLLLQELEKELREWDLLGLPRPLVESSSPSTFLTFKHRNYESVLGMQGFCQDFPGVYEFVASLTPQEFLLVPACVLQLAGCDPIIITDGSGDGGVDCIGLVPSGSIRSLCVFVQARTSLQEITKEAIQLEVAKFQDMKRTGLFAEYLGALGKGNSADGLAVCYAVVASAEFKDSAREYARREGILLRSPRQAAFWLSHSFSLDNLLELREKLSPILVRDLSRNLAPVITESRRDTSVCTVTPSHT